jgi:hypothetical protein
MTYELICSWLDLPADCWPPDHYTLLGLQPGEVDAVQVENLVHERMDRVRRYQLTHPEIATEAMNRLAQALCCLTDPNTKRAYDASLAPVPAGVAEAAPVGTAAAAGAAPGFLGWLFGGWTPTPPAPATTAPAEQKPYDWQLLPPPQGVVVAPTPGATEETFTTTASAGTEVQPVPPGILPPAPAPEPLDPLVESARSSPPARKGLATKRALYYRIARTRQLLDAWDRAGKYLSTPERTLTRPAEFADLTRQLQTIKELLRSFPPLLGEHDQPGSYVLVLARQAQVAPILKRYSLSQREILSRDWRDGRTVLAAHRHFLREQLRALREQGWLRRFVRVMSAGVVDHAARLVFLGATIALYLAWSYVQKDPKLDQFVILHQFVVICGLLAINLVLWWNTLWPAPLRKPQVVTARPRPRPRPGVGKPAN